MSADRGRALLDGPLRVLNVGLPEFADTLAGQGVAVAHLDWRPPGAGDPAVTWALARLSGDAADAAAPGSRIDQANAVAVARLLAARPVWVDVVKASDAWPDGARRLLHAGPPLAWEQMCGPMRGTLVGAVLFEGWADTPQAATALLDRGAIALAPCHHHGAVAPMAGVVSPGMSLVVVRDAATGTVAYSNLNEGLGKVLRFGAYGPDVLARLRWMEDVLAPTLRAALAAAGGKVDVAAILAQALHMGDDGHNRNQAATALLFRQLTLALLATDLPAERVRAALAFVDGNAHFFLNLSMAMAKCALDAAHGVPHSSLVTAMSRNGVEFGIRVSGLGDTWFTAPATIPEGLYFAGYDEADANPDMGDSAITETAGLGGFAMAAAPALVQFVGSSVAAALDYSRAMGTITLARHPAYTLPPLDFAGTPTGIDLRRVVDSGTAPVINTGIAHREPGVGQVGAGIVRAPLACFEQALLALARASGVAA